MRLTVRGGWQQTEGEVGDGGGGGVAVQWRHLEACCRALCEENQGSAAETRPKRWLPRTQRLRAADGVKWIYWTPAWRKTEGFIPFFVLSVDCLCWEVTGESNTQLLSFFSSRVFAQNVGRRPALSIASDVCRKKDYESQTDPFWEWCRRGGN